MTDENMTVPSGKIKLGQSAKKIKVGLSAADWKEIDAAPAMTYGSAFEALGELNKGATDRQLVAFIMSIAKGKVSTFDRERLFSALRKHFSAVKTAYLNGAHELCLARLEGAAAADKDAKRVKNNVAVHDYADRVEYARKKLRDHNLGTPDESPDLYRFGSEIARIVSVAETDTVSVEIVNRETFGAHLSAVAPFVKPLGEESEVGVAAPQDVVTALYTEASPPLPFLRGVTRFPTFSERGVYSLRNGYNRQTFDYLALPVGLQIEVPDLAEAKRLLVEEVLADFPFDGMSRKEIMVGFRGEGDAKLPASLLNCIGTLVAQLVREMIQGPQPGVLTTKPEAGTGATYLVSVMQTIVSGASNIRPPLSKSEDDRRKVLFTAIMSGEPLMCFDNMAGDVDSPTLASMWTTTEWTDRVLGRSQERTIPLRSTTIMTSNNALFSEELQRRLTLIRLDAKRADPKVRGGWRHADLLGWVATNRGKLIGALIRLIQNWVDGGCQGPKHCPAIASYPGYCFVVGGILEAADAAWTTFQGNRDQIGRVASTDEDDDVFELVQLMRAQPSLRNGATAADIAAAVEIAQLELPIKRRGHDSHAYSPKALGKYLATHAGRRFDIGGGQEVEVVKESSGGKHAARWKLVTHEVEQTKAAKVEQTGPRVSATYRNYPMASKRAHGQRRNESEAETGTVSRREGRGRRRDRSPDLKVVTSSAPAVKNPFAGSA